MTIDFMYHEIKQTSDIKELMKIIFKTEKQASIATKIVEMIKERGEVYDSDMKILAKTVNCSEKWFYSKILRTLRKLGILRKEFNKYYLSTNFPNALRRLERTARSLLENK